MEGLHAAAYAYYSRGNEDTRNRAHAFFESMDTDCDHRISYPEFYDFVQQSGYNGILPNDWNLFVQLDRNHDGLLDFYEVLTFYYIIKTGYIACRSCGEHLCGLYFTCVQCFDAADYNYPRYDHYPTSYPTYDLCAACYGKGNYSHHQHSYFLDNRVLLRSKRGTPRAPSNLYMAVLPPQTPQNLHVITNNNYYGSLVPAAPQPQRNRWHEAFQVLEAALSISALVSNCTIM